MTEPSARSGARSEPAMDGLGLGLGHAHGVGLRLGLRLGLGLGLLACTSSPTVPPAAPIVAPAPPPAPRVPPAEAPVGVRVPPTPRQGIVEIAVGERVSCARLEHGEVRCWGNNADGRAGLGDTPYAPVPTLVEGLPRETSVPSPIWPCSLSPQQCTRPASSSAQPGGCPPPVRSSSRHRAGRSRAARPPA